MIKSIKTTNDASPRSFHLHAAPTKAKQQTLNNTKQVGYYPNEKGGFKTNNPIGITGQFLSCPFPEPAFSESEWHALFIEAIPELPFLDQAPLPQVTQTLNGWCVQI